MTAEGARSAPAPWGKGISKEDAALLERVLQGVCRYRMQVPAIFMMESLMPLAFVGSQAMHFLSPMVSLFMAPTDYERMARLVERKDVIEQMMCRLEQDLSSEKG